MEYINVYESFIQEYKRSNYERPKLHKEIGFTPGSFTRKIWWK